MTRKIKLKIKKISIMALLIFAILPLTVTSTMSYELNKEGIASWYGGGEKLNKYTASGEVFNPDELTCASWDYPFNTELLVTNLENGKSVIVRVNDRGPNKKLNRTIDLTRQAFMQIAELEKGLIVVRIEKKE